MRRFFEEAICDPGQVPVVDYFCHTWDFNTWWRGKDKYKNVHEPLPEGDAETFVKALEPKACVVDSRRRPTHRRWEDMMYSFMRSVHLKREYELQQGFAYDLVIKSRYDICFEPHRRFNCHAPAPLTAYTSNPISKFVHEVYQSDFHDVMFWSDSLTMDLLGDAVRTYVRECPVDCVNHPSRSRWMRFGPGVILNHHMNSLGIRGETNPTPSLTYSVYREKAALQGLDPLDPLDYAEIRRISLSK